MKKNRLIGILGLFLLCSCGSENKAGDAFLNYANKAIEGNYEDFSKAFCRDGQPLTEAQDTLNRHVMEAYRQDLEDRFQGLKSVKILRDSVYDDGARSDLRVSLTFENDSTEEVEYEMCLMNGEWKINLAL